MSTITRNAASNAVERIITAMLTLLVVPVQVRLLGIEAYGLLGFIASLQVVFNILDFGLGPTVIRQVAADTADTRRDTVALIQTFSGMYWGLATLAGLALAGGAPWLVDHWLQAGGLPRETTILAIRLLAVTVMLRWPVALYAGAITGNQRLDIVNLIRIGVSMLKLVGGLIVLVVFRGLTAYLIWLALVGLAEVTGYMAIAVKVVPGLSLRPAFSWGPLDKVWRFSLQMNLISILAVLFVQTDRLVIGRQRPLADLGFYSVAYSLVSGLSIIQSVVTTALFPALARQVGAGVQADVRKQCSVATELLMYVVSGIACALIFFGQPILAAWISPEAAARSSAPAAILALGFMASAAVSVPYTLAVAAGLTAAPLVVNLVAGAAYVPALYWLVGRWGIEGAAWAWVGLNTYYLIVMLPLLQRRLPVEAVGPWFVRHVLPFIGTAAVVFGGSQLAATRFGPKGAWPSAMWLAGGGVAYAAIAFTFLDKSVLSRLRA